MAARPAPPGPPLVMALGEDPLIERLRRRLREVVPPPPEGIGDDGARLRPRPGHDLVWTTDLLVEGVHFRRRWGEPEALGGKAVAVNLSDLAAMGARPRGFLLGLALPPRLPVAWVDGLARGIRRAARRAGAACCGGDTCAAGRRILIAVAAAGEVPRGRLLRRDGARPGDGLYVSGPLGAAALGLRLLRGRRAAADRARDENRAIRALLDPRPPLWLGPWLLRRGLASAAMDLSDGLSVDLERLCRASRAGARVDVGRVPLHPVVRRWGRAGRAGTDQRLRLALHGGEDYQLLFTVPPRHEAELRYLPRRAGVRPVRVGEIRGHREGLCLMGPGGELRPLRPDGFRHFGVRCR